MTKIKVVTVFCEAAKLAELAKYGDVTCVKLNCM